MMSKRTTTDSAVEKPLGWHPTPPEAVLPLDAHLPPMRTFYEPCAGDYALAGTLEDLGHICACAYDVEPRDARVKQQDAAALEDLHPDVPLITNPPYEWHLLKPLMDHWIGQHDMWLLLPLDMIANLRFSAYATHIDKIVPLGRVSWMGNGKAGMENSAWLHFAKTPQPFIARRQPKQRKPKC